jgi:hypothetical protein
LFYISYGLFYVSYGLFYISYGLFHISHGLFYISYGLFYMSYGLFYMFYGSFHISYVATRRYSPFTELSLDSPSCRSIHRAVARFTELSLDSPSCRRSDLGRPELFLRCGTISALGSSHPFKDPPSWRTPPEYLSREFPFSFFVSK